MINYICRSLHANAGSELQQERDEESGREDSLFEDNSQGLPSLSKASLCSQSSIPKERGDESDTDSEEDCNQHSTNVSTENLSLNVTTLNTNQDPLGSAIESESITSHCSSSTVEDETDGGLGGSKQNSSKQMTSYRFAAVSYTCCK